MNPTIHSADATADAVAAPLLEIVVEDVCRDLGGRVPRSRVLQITTELAERYRDATITVYIPILLRRQVRERLDAELHPAHERRVVHERLREELRRRNVVGTKKHDASVPFGQA